MASFFSAGLPSRPRPRLHGNLPPAFVNLPWRALLAGPTVLVCEHCLAPGRSVLLLNYGLKPTVHLLLTAVVGGASASRIAAALVGMYNLLWLFPAYLISFLVNCIW